MRRAVSKYSTAAVAEEPITPPVKVELTQLLINGRLVDSASGRTIPTFDPRSGDGIAHIAEGAAKDINIAVSIVRKAFNEGSWPKLTTYERSKVLFKFADHIQQHNDDIAALETWDNGKPHEEAATIEVSMLGCLMRYYAALSYANTPRTNRCDKANNSVKLSPAHVCLEGRACIGMW